MIAATRGSPDRSSIRSGSTSDLVWFPVLNENGKSDFSERLESSTNCRNLMPSIGSSNGYNRGDAKFGNNRLSQTYSNFQPDVGASQLTPYQLQKKKMKSKFTFPNGEAFTPKQTGTSSAITVSPTTLARSRSQNSLSSSESIEAGSYKKQNASETNQAKSKKKDSLMGSMLKKVIRTPKLSLKKLLNGGSPQDDETVANEDNGCQPEKSTKDNSNEIDIDCELVQKINKQVLDSDAESTNNSFVEVGDAQADTDPHPYRNLHSMATNSKPALENTLTFESSFNSTVTSSSTRKSIRFEPHLTVIETFSSEEYVRKNPVIEVEKDTTKPCKGAVVDPMILIKREVNDFKKKEMQVHRDSQQYTHFYIV